MILKRLDKTKGDNEMTITMTKTTQVATQLIDGLDTELVEYVKQKLAEKLKRKPKPDFYYEGSPIYKFGDTGTGFYTLVDDTDNQIVYFVRYKLIKHNGFHFGRQILVWRNSDSILATGFAKEMFFNVLLPKYGSLIADQEQTGDGKRFWSYCIKEAIHNDKYHVYLLDRRSGENKLIPVKNTAEFRLLAKDAWGVEDAFRRVLFVISLTPLQLVPKHLRAAK